MIISEWTLLVVLLYLPGLGTHIGGLMAAIPKRVATSAGWTAQLRRLQISFLPFGPQSQQREVAVVEKSPREFPGWIL